MYILPYCSIAAFEITRVTDTDYLDSEIFVLIREEASLNVSAQDVKSPTSLLIKAVFLRFLALLAPKIGSSRGKTHFF